MDPLAIVLAVLVLGTILLSVGVVRRLDRRRGRWGDRLRERFVLGVPWGTLVVTGFVVAVYLFVQDGVADLTNPVTIPYRSWSYLYPLGMVTAPFSHASLGHVVGNLSGTLVLAPIVEYVWGHYPRERGSTAFGGWRRNPWVRALVVFPLATIAVGLFSSVFALGPVIGFSGVVFAFAGFALVRYPLGTVVAMVGGQGVLVTLFWALRSPVVVTTAQASPPSPPSWASIAIQGHAIGFFAGLLLGVALLDRRGFRPDPVRFWLALVLFGFAQGLWQVYWFGGEGVYVLFRGPGVVVVLSVALLVTLAITASDRPLLSRNGDRSGSTGDAGRSRSVSGVVRSSFPAAIARRARRPRRGSDSALERAVELGASGAATAGDRAGSRIRELAVGRSAATDSPYGTGRRTAALVAVVVLFAALTGAAVPVNLVAFGESDGTTATLTVEDYAVTYDEAVENRLISAVPIDRFADETAVEASGVIVWSDERGIWTNPVTADALAFSGETTVDLGGPGWRTPVTVEREGWRPVGNDTVYQVWLSAPDDRETLAYASEPSRADVTVDNRSIAIVPDHEDGRFGLEIDDGDDVTTVRLPLAHESVEVSGVTIVRDEETLYAEADGTRAHVASEETYVDS